MNMVEELNLRVKFESDGSGWMMSKHVEPRTAYKLASGSNGYANYFVPLTDEEATRFNQQTIERNGKRGVIIPSVWAGYVTR